jgi:hypothetical protein
MAADSTFNAFVGLKRAMYQLNYTDTSAHAGTIAPLVPQALIQKTEWDAAN